VRRFLALPGVETPSVVVPLDEAAALRYAFEYLLVPGQRWKIARNRLLLELLVRGRAPAVYPQLTLATRVPGPPLVLADAATGAGVPLTGAWCLTPGQGSIRTRGVFHVFERDAARPTWAVKFGRLRGDAERFELDERSFALVDSLAPALAAHAPRLIGRFRSDGHEASVETEAVGQRLIAYLHTFASRRAKLGAIEAVADWLVRVAVATTAPPATLEPERARVATEILPLWRSSGIAPDTVDRLPPLPAVLVHLDLGTWNVVADANGFAVLDWESARPHGFPLWDLVYFLSDALAHLDGAGHIDARPAHLVSLFRGELASSAPLFSWIRRMVDAVGLPQETVPAIVTLAFLEAAAGDTVPAGADPPLYAQLARAWVDDPELGIGWPRWNDHRITPRATPVPCARERP
jgi:hypothetical protein